jgi:hypothetical protein
MKTQLVVTCELFLPILISSSALAIEQHPAQIATTRTGAIPKDGYSRIASLQNWVVTKNSPEVLSSDKQPSASPKSVNRNNLNVALENCRRAGNSVTCHLQFTNMAIAPQEINLFADCSRIIHGNVEFGGFNGQIGQGSSATQKKGIAREGFITFRNVAAHITTAKVLEVAYGTNNGDATVRFNNVDIE